MKEAISESDGNYQEEYKKIATLPYANSIYYIFEKWTENGFVGEVFKQGKNNMLLKEEKKQVIEKIYNYYFELLRKKTEKEAIGIQEKRKRLTMIKLMQRLYKN